MLKTMRFNDSFSNEKETKDELKSTEKYHNKLIYIDEFSISGRK